MCIDFLVVSCIVDLPLLKETLKWSSILFHTASGTSKDVTNSIVDLLEMLNCGLAQNQIPGKLQEPLLPTGWCSPPTVRLRYWSGSPPSLGTDSSPSRLPGHGLPRVLTSLYLITGFGP